MQAELETPSNLAAPIQTAVPDLVFECFTNADSRHPAVMEMGGLLQLFLNSSTLRGRFETYFLLMRWLGQADSTIPLPTDDHLSDPTALDPLWRRSHVMRAVVVRSAALRARFAAALGSMIAETRSVSFFAEAGLPQGHGFLSEAITRGIGFFIPSPRKDDDLEQQFQRLYRSPRKARRFSQIPPEMFNEIVTAFAMPDHHEIWEPARAAIREAFQLLAARVQALGLSSEFRERGSFTSVNDSPFFQLTRVTDTLLRTLGQDSGVEAAHQQWLAEVKRCRNEIRHVQFKLNTAGVSVAIVFAIEIIEKCLHRMETIADVMTLPHGAKRSNAIHRLISICIIAACEDRSLRSLVGTNVHLLSRKIVERTGSTGEHYIARSMKEYWWMWAAAAGGGLLTVATATLKMKIVGLHAAPLMEGLLASVNYAVSFILLIVMGLALATKQPAMTGAALGGILREHSGLERLERITTTAMLICRTQIAAAMGNVLLVTLGSLLLAQVWMASFNEPILDAHAAEHVLESLNPLTSGTIFFGALTGVILWASSLVGGWIENWSVCNKLPLAIADHSLGNTIGVERMRRIARFWDHNVAAWSTSIALGFMLGMVPVLGKFAGLPIDVRHVTLSTGTLALSASSLPDVPLQYLLMAVAGIAVIFVLNLTVSFLLAFATAAWAYKVSFKELLQLLKMFARRALFEPWAFVLPLTWPSVEEHSTPGATPAIKDAAPAA